MNKPKEQPKNKGIHLAWLAGLWTASFIVMQLYHAGHYGLTAVFMFALGLVTGIGSMAMKEWKLGSPNVALYRGTLIVLATIAWWLLYVNHQYVGLIIHGVVMTGIVGFWIGSWVEQTRNGK